MDITVLLGAPGAGKGTVAARIVGTLGARHVSTGAMLREALKAGTPAGLQAKSFMESGGLVPDEVMAQLVSDLLDAAPADARFILDGFPRTVRQAELLDTMTARHGQKVNRAVCIDVPSAMLLERLGGRRVCPACSANFHVLSLAPRVAGICDACGTALVIRTDDQPATIQNRLAVYEAQTAPLTARYEAAGKLLRVDGSGDADSVAAAVRALIAG